MTAQTKLPDDLDDAFVYLDELRADGSTNMFGAGAYLERDLEYDRGTARAVLSAWMETFDDNRPAELRAKQAVASAA